jgi:hypothetical protein
MMTPGMPEQGSVMSSAIEIVRADYRKIGAWHADRPSRCVDSPIPLQQVAATIPRFAVRADP